eukprot:gnl/Spiro4/12700_TR6729_c0_g2_i1.p1 gnl/Spiro4/12700_TR6729_c0_g2~~gnl/Spiro4/12700_TR6729_c0_g2_i1.p1  ORF type:complete len:111 (+),score=8.30 gnl/Spiro4/12700_TR6729_c0_g2_i1:26-358(+)
MNGDVRLFPRHYVCRFAHLPPVTGIYSSPQDNSSLNDEDCAAEPELGFSLFAKSARSSGSSASPSCSASVSRFSKKRSIIADIRRVVAPLKRRSASASASVVVLRQVFST